jgi:hypothetical protein
MKNPRKGKALDCLRGMWRSSGWGIDNSVTPSFLVSIPADNTAVTNLRFASTAAFTLSWGDGTANLSLAANTTGLQSHTYAKKGIYRVTFLTGWQSLYRLRLLGMYGIGKFPFELLRPSITTEFIIGGNAWTNDISDMQAPLIANGATITTLQIGDTEFVGSLSNFSFAANTALTRIDLTNMPNVIGDVTTIAFPNSLRIISLQGMSKLTGDIATFINGLNNSMTSLILGAVNAVGTQAAYNFGRRMADAAFTGSLNSVNWAAKTALVELRLGGLLGISANVATITWPTGTLYLWIGGSDDAPNNNISGNLASMALPASLIWYMIQNAPNVTGDLSAVNLPDSVQIIYLQNTGITNPPLLSNTPNIRAAKLYNLGLTLAQQKAVLNNAFSNWASFTWTGWAAGNKPLIEFRITSTSLGTDTRPAAALDGTYADEDPPTTGKGLVYEMEVDPETTGRRLWDWTYYNEP